MSYEPPITLQIPNEIYNETVRNAEETIIKEIVKIVNVDRDELIMALQYDRKQYDKGYADALRYFDSEDFVKVVRCSVCKNVIIEDKGDGKSAYWCPINRNYRCYNEFCNRGERRIHNA